MLRYELKKLLFKQYGLILAVWLTIAEIILLNSLYVNMDFPNEITEEHYNNYMQVLEGRLTEEKENFILAEQKEVLTAQSDMKKLQSDLIAGKLKDDEEYLRQYAGLEPKLKKADAFQIVFDKYTYALKAPDERYIMNDCEGMGRDYPDIPVLLFAVTVTAVNFLSEENSGMIILIRSCTHRKNNIFTAKLLSIIISVLAFSLFSAVCEYVLLTESIGAYALNYPIQSIKYFSGCGYDMSISEVFIAMNIIRFAGYVFIILLTVLLAVTVKKAVPVMSVPLALCLIQQFIFSEADKAYYLPTGFLRAAGFFRGDTYGTASNYNGTENRKIFTAVPQAAIIFSTISVIIFAAVTVIVGLKYYKGKKIKNNFKVIASLMIAAMIMTGCAEKEDTSISINMRHTSFFLQDENYYYIDSNDKMYAVSKSDGSKFPVIRTPFDKDILQIAGKCIVGDDMYFFQPDGIKGFTIRKVSLTDFSMEIAAEQSGSIGYSFLGLEYDDTIVFDKTVLNFFTDGDRLFLITSDYEVYTCGFDLKNGECIISDGIFGGNSLIFDGTNIYYINNTLELKILDSYTLEEKVIANGFVRTFDVNDNEIIYSNKDGIFSMNIGEYVPVKLSDKTAESISFDGGHIVFSDDDKLYQLENNTAEELYSGSLVYFALIDGCDRILCRKYNFETKDYTDFFLEALA